MEKISPISTRIPFGFFIEKCYLPKEWLLGGGISVISENFGFDRFDSNKVIEGIHNWAVTNFDAKAGPSFSYPEEFTIGRRVFVVLSTKEPDFTFKPWKVNPIALKLSHTFPSRNTYEHNSFINTCVEYANKNL